MRPRARPMPSRLVRDCLRTRRRYRPWCSPDQVVAGAGNRVAPAPRRPTREQPELSAVTWLRAAADEPRSVRSRRVGRAEPGATRVADLAQRLAGLGRLCLVPGALTAG